MLHQQYSKCCTNNVILHTSMPCRQESRLRMHRALLQEYGALLRIYQARLCHFVMATNMMFKMVLMHRIATRCNARQRTAMHGNARQHTTTHGNTRKHTVTHDDTWPHTETSCNTRQHTATRGNTRKHTEARGNTRQHTATHGNTLQRDTTHCNTLQHAATRCNTLPRLYAQADRQQRQPGALQHTASHGKI